MDQPVDDNLFLAIKQELTDLEKDPDCVVHAGIPELQNTETETRNVPEEIHGSSEQAAASCNRNVNNFADVRDDKSGPQDNTCSFRGACNDAGDVCPATGHQSQTLCSDGTLTTQFGLCTSIATGGEVDKNQSEESVSYVYDRSSMEAVNVDQKGRSLNKNDKMISKETGLISNSKLGWATLPSGTSFRQSTSDNWENGTHPIWPPRQPSLSLSDCNQQDDTKLRVGELSKQIPLKNDDKVSTNLQTNLKPLICRICEKTFTKPMVLDAHYKTFHGLDSPYQCWRCVYSTSAYTCMERHMEFCGSMTPFPCEQCKEMFENTDTLSDHCLKMHSGFVGRFHCTKCFMEFESDVALAKHIQELHPSKISLGVEFFCSECGEVFENTRELLEHKSHVHSQDFTVESPTVESSDGKRKRVGKTVISPVSGVDRPVTAIKQETDVEEALVDTDRSKIRKLPKVRLIAAKGKRVGKTNFWVASKVEEDPKFASSETASNCALEGELDNKLGNEIFVNTTEPKKMGEKAPKVKKSKSGLPGGAVKSKPKKEKVDGDNCDTLYLCPHTDVGCKYKSTKKSNLAYHMRIHKNRYSCECCDFQCCKKVQLKLHYKSAHGRDVNPGYLCSMCGKSFKNGTKLKIHIRVHNNDRPYICDQCGQGFASKYMMSEHQKVKHGGKIFPCEMCGKEFPVKKYLSKHVKTHDSTKSFLCDVCPKAFKTANHLKAHTRVHTGEKPFECKECGKHFKQICGLMAHKNVHKGEKTFNCTICRRAFMYSTSLRAGLCLHCRKSGHEFESNSKTLQKDNFTDFVKSGNSGFIPNVYVPVAGIPGITTSTVAGNFVNFAKAGSSVVPSMAAPFIPGVSSESL